jgi:hypothetical protein
MNALAPKLVLTPLLVASMSLAGRRWGGAFSGWLVALPLTSGPVVLFIALEAGPELAGQAAAGALLGASAQVAFAAAYTVASRRLGWIPSLALAALAFFAVGLLVPPVAPVLAFGLLLVVVAMFLSVSAPPSDRPGDVVVPPSWDIPARVVVATVIVIVISSAAPIVGGRLSGILATFPVYGAVLATFAHLTGGSGESAAVLRGLATGLVGFGAFFLALGLLLGAVSIAASFMVALAIGGAVQAATLPLVAGASRRSRDERRSSRQRRTPVP